MNLSKENIIDDWKETIGLKIVAIQSGYMKEYDDPAELTLIIFDNGKFCIQRDQSYYTTSCGLLDKFDIENEHYQKELNTIS